MTKNNKIKISDMRTAIWSNKQDIDSDISDLSSRISKIEPIKSEVERIEHGEESNRSMLFSLKSRVGTLEYKIDAIANFLNLSFKEVDYHIECKPKEKKE